MSKIESENDPLDSFEKHWKNVIEEVKNQNFTSDMSNMTFKQWRLAIENFYQIQSKRSKYSTEEQWERVEQIEHLVTIALYKSVVNFRDNERIKLKECYGPMGELIYFFKKLFGFI